MKKTNRKGRFLMLTGLLLLAAALFLAARNLLEEHAAEKAAGEVADALHAAIPGYGEANAGDASVMNAMGSVVETAADAAGNPVVPDGGAWPRTADGELDLAIRDVLQGAWIPWPLDGAGNLLSLTLDGSGAEIDWPMDENGAPVPWPLDANGLPAASVTDAEGVAHVWPEGAVGLPAGLAEQEGFALLPADDRGRVLLQVNGAAQFAAWPVDGVGRLLPLLYADGIYAAPWPLDRQGRIISAAMALLHRREAERSLELESQPVYVRNPDMEMPILQINGNSYIGVLDIPSKGLSLPVMSEWSYPRLRIAPCRYSGSVYSGDIVIAGHNYARHFGPIRSMKPGDAVVFTDGDGNVFNYEVAEVEILNGAAVEAMQAGDWDLTLFTCTYGGRSRCALRCRLLNSVPAT